MTIPTEILGSQWVVLPLTEISYNVQKRSEFQQRRRKDDESSYRLSLVDRTSGLSKEG